MEKKKVIIVGAGPAGLTTAYKLLKESNEIEVIILEKEDKLGGISSSINLNGYIIDTGIHRFFSKNDEINNIWEEILPIQGKPAYDDIELNRSKPYKDNGPNPETDDNCLLIKDRITRIYYGKKFYDYPINLNMTTLKNLGFLNIMIVGFSYLKACIFKKPETSLENLYINKFGKKLYEMFFKSYTEKVWGISPNKISADWGNQRVKGISIKEILKDIIRKAFKKKNKANTETSLIESFVYPKLGTIQMWNEMANKIKSLGGKIYLNTIVKNIVIKDNTVEAVIYEKDNITYTENLDIVISSMPIKELFEGFRNSNIPEDIYDIATNLPYRDFMSVGLVVNKLTLQNKTKSKTLGNILPDSWIYIQEPDITMGRLQIFNNWSPYMFKDKTEMDKKVILGLEYFASEDDKYWNMSDKEFIDFAIGEAEKIGLLNRSDVEESIRIKIPKAYPAYFGTYSDIDRVITYLNTISNLYCIGRNGQHRYNNMDHSMLTGIETANHIMNKLENKQIIWNVNTEQEYHETKVN